MSKTTTIANSVKHHYDDILAPIYSWIIGDFESAYRRNVELFAAMQIQCNSAATAVDLGCGPGCQSIPLAEAGFHVIGIDFCDELLAETKRRAGNLPVLTVNDDIVNFATHLTDAPELVVCMGDTLVHLPDEPTVQALLSAVANRLRPGGTFIATLRDYSKSPPLGPHRFIPVRSTDDRIFTCFLEYRGDTIDVHDILHTRENGEWQLRISQYQKLALDYWKVVAWLRQCSMTVDAPRLDQGMVVIRASKPQR